MFWRKDYQQLINLMLRLEERISKLEESVRISDSHIQALSNTEVKAEKIITEQMITDKVFLCSRCCAEESYKPYWKKGNVYL